MRVDGEVVDAPSICIIRIVNSGRLAIGKEDWDGPVHVSLEATQGRERSFTVRPTPWMLGQNVLRASTIVGRRLFEE